VALVPSSSVPVFVRSCMFIVEPLSTCIVPELELPATSLETFAAVVLSDTGAPRSPAVRDGLQKYVEGPLSVQLLQGKFKAGECVIVNAKADNTGLEFVKGECGVTEPVKPDSVSIAQTDVAPHTDTASCKVKRFSSSKAGRLEVTRQLFCVYTLARLPPIIDATLTLNR